MTTATATSVRRPFGISFISFLLILQGVLEVIGGIVILVAHDRAEVREALREVSSGEINALGWIIIVFGIVTILVGAALRSGRDWARALVAVVAVAHVVTLVWSVITHHGLHWLQILFPAVVYLLVAAYLYGDEEVKSYFASGYR